MVLVRSTDLAATQRRRIFCITKFDQSAFYFESLSEGPFRNPPQGTRTKPKAWEVDRTESLDFLAAALNVRFKLCVCCLGAFLVRRFSVLQRQPFLRE